MSTQNQQNNQNIFNNIDDNNINNFNDMVINLDETLDDNLDKKTTTSKPRQNSKDENTLWVSVSEAAKLGGVQNKTIRRAIQANNLRYKIVGNRYQIDFQSLVIFLHTNKKLTNKLKINGIGRFIKEWEDLGQLEQAD